jgi:hypothetical protein
MVGDHDARLELRNNAGSHLADTRMPLHRHQEHIRLAKASQLIELLASCTSSAQMLYHLPALQA